MKPGDIRSRSAALEGDIEARRQLGLKFLVGQGVARQPEVALNYLEGLLDDPEVAIAVADHIPLELLVRKHLVQILRRTSGTSSTAAAKLLAWDFLAGEDCGAHPAKEFEESHSRGAIDRGTVHSILGRRDLMSIEPLLIEAFRQLPNRTAHLIQVCLNSGAALNAAREKIGELVAAAEHGQGNLHPLTPKQICELLSECRSPYAHYVLGRAQIGFSCGQLSWDALVPKRNYREGYTHLLRAAHGGASGAWYHLYRSCSDYRSVLGNVTAADFFLEKGAAEGHVESQTVLGIRTLASARTTDDLVFGQQWLCISAAADNRDAETVLLTFFSAYSQTNTEYAESTLSRIASLDPLLCAILRVSREFQLTRKEAFGLDFSTCIQADSLVFVPERRSTPFALPAITARAKDALRLLSRLALSRELPSGAGFERRRAAAQRALFANYGFEESAFFADYDPDNAHRRDVGTWKKMNAPLLRRLLAAYAGPDAPRA